MNFFLIQVLNQYEINKAKIGALVFDTTSLNTGHKNGIVVRLEREFGRSLLQLECRHHILELVCGAACSLIYGQTTGPKEEFFKKLKNNWNEFELDDYAHIEIPHHQRELTRHTKEMITFLQEWIKKSTKQSLRHDYLDLGTFTLLFLGGTIPKNLRNVTIKSPGAYHHARWMSKVLYTLKIALLKKQLGKYYKSEHLEDIYNLAIFLSLFYTKAWLTCTDAANSPSNDLELMKKLLKAEASIEKNPNSWPAKFLSLVKLAREKLEKHLGYLSERLVPLALFSDRVPSSEKKK